MRLLKNIALVLVFASCLLVGCKDEDDNPVIVFDGNEVLISNEGNFGWGEGSLSLYNPESKQVQNDVFKSRNGVGIGNVFQSISYHINQYFFVVNNSNKIVLATDSFQKTSEIIGLTSPRYFYRVADHKAYVTDLYSNSIAVVDMKALTVNSQITMNGWTEKAVVYDSSFWVTAPETEYVYLIDIATDSIQDSVQVGFAPESIVLDNNRMIWVLCKGDAASSKSAKLVTINPKTKSITRSISVTGLPVNLVYDNIFNKLFFLNDGVYSMAAESTADPELWKSSNNNNFYGLGVNPNNGEVYVSDIHDFVQKSSVFRFSSEGVLLDEFKTGIIAGNFFFHHK